MFSDDSGVDVKARGSCAAAAAASSESRRNKRKSSEPRKRKDVLLMKRFRWDTDEEDLVQGNTEDVFERPSSGDSGCHLEEEEEEDEEEDPPLDKKKRRKEDEERQSVIRKSGGARTPQECADSSESDSRNRTRPRNYKSMSRQRRIEANARERTRVHTISAAFESLRRAVPAYAHNQKLSKLAILRIASAYIVALACLNGSNSTSPSTSMAECVEQCTRTIQAEGRSRRRTYKVSGHFYPSNLPSFTQTLHNTLPSVTQLSRCLGTRHY